MIRKEVLYNFIGEAYLICSVCIWIDKSHILLSRMSQIKIIYPFLCRNVAGLEMPCTGLLRHSRAYSCSSSTCQLLSYWSANHAFPLQTHCPPRPHFRQTRGNRWRGNRSRWQSPCNADSSQRCKPLDQIPAKIFLTCAHPLILYRPASGNPTLGITHLWTPTGQNSIKLEN